jgi:hypothetical protein
MPSCCRQAMFLFLPSGNLELPLRLSPMCMYCRLSLHTLDAVRHQEKSSVVAGRACLLACPDECLQSFPSLSIVSQAVQPPAILVLSCTESQRLFTSSPTTAGTWPALLGRQTRCQKQRLSPGDGQSSPLGLPPKAACLPSLSILMCTASSVHGTDVLSLVKPALFLTRGIGACGSAVLMCVGGVGKTESLSFFSCGHLGR